ncbi:peroxisomal membrane protein 2-like [Lineus longissimus]|uniref:peroxisomal membrane protein 2-like n=1 Tax=Lineus longissimus TaxID=88925 RepID=UPI002B4F4E98
MSFSKERHGGVIDRYLTLYVKYLREKPVLTKAISSGLIAGLGDLIAQVIKYNPGKGQHIRLRSTAAFATFGFVFAGPLTHQFYIWLDQWVPKTASYCALKRIMIDRLILTPPYMLLFFYVVTVIEGHGFKMATQKIRETFWPVLQMNWKIWTLFQYVNVNYIPSEYRVLFASCISLVWNIYLASTRR